MINKTQNLKTLGVKLITPNKLPNTKSTSSSLFNITHNKSNTKEMTTDDILLKSKNLYIKLPSKNQKNESQFNTDLKEFLNNPTGFIKKNPQQNIYILEVIKLLPSNYKFDMPDLSKIDFSEITLIQKGVLQNILELPQEKTPDISKLHLANLNQLLTADIFSKTLNLPSNKQPKFSKIDLVKAKIKLTNELLKQIITLPKENQPIISNFDGLDLSDIDLSSLKLGKNLSFNKTNFSNCTIDTKDFKNIFSVLNITNNSILDNIKLIGDFKDIENILPRLIEFDIKVNLNKLTYFLTIEDDGLGTTYNKIEEQKILTPNLKPNIVYKFTASNSDEFRKNLDIILISHNKSNEIPKVLFNLPRLNYIDSSNMLYKNRDNLIGSILEIIDSLDNKYANLKIQLMEHMTKISKNSSISSLNPFQISIWLNFINSNKVDKIKFMLENSSLIVQIIYYGRKLENSNLLKEKILSLEKDYLNINEINKVKEQLENDFYFFQDNDTLIFFEPSKGEHLAISEKYYEQWLIDLNYKLPVNNAYWFKDNNNEAIKDPKELFKTFKLFEATYSFIQSSILIFNFFELLNLDNMSPNFLSAIQRTYYKDKLIGLEEEPLIPIFSKLVNGEIFSHGKTAKNIKITEDHFNEIITTFNVKTPLSQLKLLLTLSAIMVKLSSADMFGTEYDSPLTLRNYSSGLLNKVSEIINNYTPKSYEYEFKNIKEILNKSILEDWIDRLAGLNSKIQCTSILYNMIVEKCKDVCPKTLNQLLPHAWR